MVLNPLLILMLSPDFKAAALNLEKAQAVLVVIVLSFWLGDAVKAEGSER